jgi:acetylornithine/N-succinyldiaminopimelate aminotransferase
MAVALAAVEELVKPELLDHVRRVAGYFAQSLEGLKQRYPDVVLEIRGRGLLIGLKLAVGNRGFMQLARDQRLLIAGGSDNCVRLLPPLIISEEDAREVMRRLEAVCEAARAQARSPAVAS